MREKDHTGSYTYNDPVVYFTLALVMDVEPDEFTHRIDIEWRRQGGKRLSVNELGCFTTATPGAFYRLWNNFHQKDLTEEIRLIMQETYDHDEKTKALPDEFLLDNVPRTKWRRNVPKLPGQNTQQFDT